MVVGGCGAGVCGCRVQNINSDVLFLSSKARVHFLHPLCILFCCIPGESNSENSKKRMYMK